MDRKTFETLLKCHNMFLILRRYRSPFTKRTKRTHWSAWVVSTEPDPNNPWLRNLHICAAGQKRGTVMRKVIRQFIKGRY